MLPLTMRNLSLRTNRHIEFQSLRIKIIDFIPPQQRINLVIQSV